MKPGHKTGVLVINLGSPDSPETGDVRRYLKQFLSDPRVIDINPVARWLLLNLIILRTRPKQSGVAYKTIWTEEGSPLVVYGKQLVTMLDQELENYPVVLAMRYGNPSIESGLEELVRRGCDSVVIFPMYPQYASSSTGSCMEVVHRELAALWNTPAIHVVPPFYDHPDFIASFEAVARPVMDREKPDYVLFSYHGLPEHHIRKSDPSGYCRISDDCCAQSCRENQYCYRAQCYATTRALVEALGLTNDTWSIAFQSRLGRSPWLDPNTAIVVPELARQGVKRLAVMCPSFVADCLETLEEIDDRAKELFLAAGGEELIMVPSLNVHPRWVEAAANLIQEAAPKLSLPPPPGDVRGIG